jgi:hypothetical protein
MQSSRDFSALVGRQKLIEAGQWWASFDQAVEAYRNLAAIYIAYDCRRSQSPDLHRIARVQAFVHDMMLIQVEKIWSASRCAVAAELAGRIYYEKYEEREFDVDDPDSHRTLI